jgi:hypothetical protein
MADLFEDFELALDDLTDHGVSANLSLGLGQEVASPWPVRVRRATYSNTKRRHRGLATGSFVSPLDGARPLSHEKTTEADPQVTQWRHEDRKCGNHGNRANHDDQEQFLPGFPACPTASLIMDHVVLPLFPTQSTK